LESDLSLEDPRRKNDAARATRDFDRAGLSEEPSVSSTMAAKAASSRESLRFFSFDRCSAKSNENLRRGLSARSMVAVWRRGGGGVSRGSDAVVSAGRAARRRRLIGL